MKIVPLIVIALLLAGAFTSSCKHYGSEPTDSTKCDTCCDTCKTDTTHHPCDTCNLNKDSLAHAFIWTEYVISEEPSPTGVWVFGDDDIYVVGNRLWHYDGTGFQRMDMFNQTTGTALGGINGLNIFAFSKEDYWMVHGSIAFHCNYSLGSKDYFDEFRPGNANACWGTSSTDIFIVGNSGQIHHYDGTKFTDMVSGTTKDLRSVWGTSHNDVWTCGYSSSKGETVLLHYDGISWKEDNISLTNNAITGGFNGVWACDSAGHKFATTSGGLLIRKTDNGNWRSDSGLIPNRIGDGSFVGIAPRGNTANDMFAIGPWGFIAHWNGKDWKKYDQLFEYGNPAYYTAAFSVNGNTACAVGVKSGQSWVAIGRRKQ